MLKPDYVLSHIEVFYEPPPKPPDMSWLQEARSYGMPDRSKVLRPKVTPPYTYTDRTRGDVDVDPDGNFSVPIKFFEDRPGIYTIMTWAKRGSGKAFPATEVCVRVDG
jgi:hypothetical protein